MRGDGGVPRRPGRQLPVGRAHRRGLHRERRIGGGARGLTITPGSALVAAFALNDLTGKGTSKLTVFGTVSVLRGATLIMGSDASSFACADDPDQTAPTLSAPISSGVC